MSNLFAPDPAPVIQQAAPAVAPPPVMPDPQSPDTMAARRRAQQDVMGRAGRTSTILSSAMSRGDSVRPYGATKLGSDT